VRIETLIAIAEREVAMRRRVYPRLVGAGTMTQKDADEETQGMAEIAALLRRQPPTQAGLFDDDG
jgi:hypothetical protein